MKLTVAQALIKYLDNQYIDIDGQEIKFVHGIVAIFGHGCVLGMGEALEATDHQLAFYQGKHEQGQGQMAVGFTKQKNRRQIMAVTSSIGPGAANMITAAATATVNHLPVLFLPGDIYASRQPDPALQQIENDADYTISTNDAFKPVCRYFDRVIRPEQLMTAMQNAMRTLTDPAKAGAVCIALPQDVQAEAWDYPEEFFQKRVHRIPRRPLEDIDIEKISSILATKKKPVIICGGGVRYSEANKELQEFAEAFNIPVVETQAGKSSLLWEHPLYMGNVGLTGTLSANKIVKEADCIIALGTRLNDFHTSSKTAFADDIEIINININNFDAIKMNSHPFCADIKVALLQLISKLLLMSYQSQFTTEPSQYKQEWTEESNRLFDMDSSEGIWQTKVLGFYNRSVKDDAIVITASGSLPSDLERLWRSKGINTYCAEYGYSCMGAEIGLAVGVKIAEPNKDVYCFVGDGGYVMSHSELLTSIQENLKINVIVIDNHGFQCIHNLQNNFGIPDYGCEYRFKTKSGRIDGKFLPVDFAMNARSYGCEAWTVNTDDELKEAFKKAQKSSVTTLLDVKTFIKSMTDGYETWWRVGIPEVSTYKSVTEHYKKHQEDIKKAKQF
ncbi:MAG: 3D-(3,5/4)-trihydroxycyclohexane-1,2-dione acylhydrolase (decyclizing) [Brevinema sp.]